MQMRPRLQQLARRSRRHGEHSAGAVLLDGVECLDGRLAGRATHSRGAELGFQIVEHGAEGAVRLCVRRHCRTAMQRGRRIDHFGDLTPTLAEGAEKRAQLVREAAAEPSRSPEPELRAQPPGRVACGTRALERVERRGEACIGADLTRVDLVEHLELGIEAGRGGRSWQEYWARAKADRVKVRRRARSRGPTFGDRWTALVVIWAPIQ